jgi:hypothetical protein
MDGVPYIVVARLSGRGLTIASVSAKSITLTFGKDPKGLPLPVGAVVLGRDRTAERGERAAVRSVWGERRSGEAPSYTVGARLRDFGRGMLNASAGVAVAVGTLDLGSGTCRGVLGRVAEER